jgi:Rrf2 family protein
VQIHEIAEKLAVPQHFLAKIMKRIADEGILTSTKGPYGGFSVNEKTLQTRIIDIVQITDGTDLIDNCVLSFRKCNAKNPCPLHTKMAKLKDGFVKSLSKATIGDLMDQKNPDFIQTISSVL